MALNMNDSENAVQNAFRQFKEWLEDNNIEPISLLKVTNIESNLKLDHYEKAIDIAKRLETYNTVAQDFVDFKEQIEEQNTKPFDHNLGITFNENFVDVTKSYAEIEKSTNRTPGEQKLVDAVNIFLSPQQKKDAIDRNAPVSEIMTTIDKSIEEFQKTKAMLQEKEKEKQNNQEKNHEKKPEKKMSSLGDEYGVTDQIMKSMKEISANKANSRVLEVETVLASDVKSPQTPSKTPAQEKGNKGPSR